MKENKIKIKIKIIVCTENNLLQFEAFYEIITEKFASLYCQES
jgi:hypothetical protein